MGPARQLWGPLVSLAFIHTRGSLPEIILAFECSSISLGFGCLFRWTMSRELGWGPRVLTLFVREPTPERHKPQAQRRVCAGLCPYSESWIWRLHHPIAKSLGLQSPQGDLGAEASNLESWTWEPLGDQAGKFLRGLVIQLRGSWFCVCPVHRASGRFLTVWLVYWARHQVWKLSLGESFVLPVLEALGTRGSGDGGTLDSET